MSKFFAMLKDSYREAVDGWIFLVMLVLSAIIVLLVLSCSVEPLSPDRAIANMFNSQSLYTLSANRGESDQQIPCFFRFYPAEMGFADEKNPSQGKMTLALRLRVALPRQGSVDMDDDNMQTIETQDKVAMMIFKESVRYWDSNGNASDPQKPYTKSAGEEFLRKQIGEGTGLKLTSVSIAGDNRFIIEADGLKRPIDWPYKPTLFFGAYTLESRVAPLGTLVYTVESRLLNGIGAWVLMLAGVVATAAFIPNMLRKGSIDLLISKPISRPTILLDKYVGGLLFVFLLTALTVSGVWAVIGFRTGIWTTGILWTIPGITFYFAILYACSTLFGVLSRNAIVCIIVTVVFWFILFIIGLIYNFLVVFDSIDYEQLRKSQVTAKAMARENEKMLDKDKPKKEDKNRENANPKAANDDPVIPDLKPNPTVMKIFRTLNAITPRLNDLDTLTSQMIARGLVPEGDYRLKEKAATKVDWGEAIAVSTAWIGLFLGLALLRFVTRSY